MRWLPLRGPHRKPAIRFLPARLLLSAGYDFLFIRRYLVMRFEVFVYVNTEFFFLQITYMAVAGKDFEIFSKEFLDGFCFRRRLDYDKVFCINFCF